MIYNCQAVPLDVDDLSPYFPYFSIVKTFFLVVSCGSFVFMYSFVIFWTIDYANYIESLSL